MWCLILLTKNHTYCSRLRFLPPIDDQSFHVLRSYAVAVLDSFPVGMHLPVLEAMSAGIPVVREIEAPRRGNLICSIGLGTNFTGVHK